MKTILKIFKLMMLSFLVIIVSGCAGQSNKPYGFDSYTLGFSTPKGNTIWVYKVNLDEVGGVPVGGLGCCWKQARATTTMFKNKLPKKISIKWLDRSEERIYSGTVILDSDINKKAMGLPEYTWISDQKKGRGIYLIIGMGEDGKIVIWLSNISRETNISGRVLYVVGSTQSTYIKWVKPKFKKDTFKFPD